MKIYHRHELLSVEDFRRAIEHLRNNGLNETRAIMLVAEKAGGVYAGDERTA